MIQFEKHIFQIGWFNHQLGPEVLPKLVRFLPGWMDGKLLRTAQMWDEARF